MDAESAGVEVVSVLEQTCEGTCASVDGAQWGGDGAGPLPAPLFLCWVSLDALVLWDWGFLLIHSQSKARKGHKASPTFPVQQSLCTEQTKKNHPYSVLEICISFHANYASNYILFHPSPARMAMGNFVQAHSIILIYFFSFSDF